MEHFIKAKLHFQKTYDMAAKNSGYHPDGLNHRGSLAAAHKLALLGPREVVKSGLS